MIIFQNEKKRVIFQEGQAEPLAVGIASPWQPPGILTHPSAKANQKLIDASTGARVRAPQITYGVDYCDLNCPYCLNEYDNSTGEFALSKYGSKLESLTRLCEWIAESSEFSLGWAVGEPLSKAGLAFIERFQFALSERAKSMCYNVGLHTNGTWLAKNAFPEHLYAGYRRRSVYWTVSLLSENDESHRSIEKHFEFLLDCARNYRAKGWFRGIRMVLPTDIPLSSLPDDLISRAFQFLEEAQPDTIEPFYLVRLERSDADVHHHVFYPNCRDFLWRLSQESDLIQTLSPRQHALLIDKKTISVYDKIIQSTTPTEFLLTDLNSTVNTNQLPQIPYREYATKNLEDLMAGAVNPLCMECAGLPYCTVFQRPDLHYTMGWGRESHRQYEDTLLNMMYLYGLIYLDRVTRDESPFGFYRQQPLNGEDVELVFPLDLPALADKLREARPEEIVEVSDKGLTMTGSLVAMKLDQANLSFPDFRVDGPPKVEDGMIRFRMKRAPAPQQIPA